MTNTPYLVFCLLFTRKDGTTYPTEIASPTLEEAITFIEKRDGSTFHSEIIFG